MAKVGIVGEGIMMGDLKGKVSEDQRKSFNEGVEYGKLQGSKEADEVWSMYFDLLYYIKDSNFFLKMIVEGVDSERLDEHFFEGAKKIYEELIEFADEITEDLDDEEELDEEELEDEESDEEK
jgi:hypothetical protein